MVSDLLPVKNEAPKCRDFTLALNARPFGTGLRLDRAILVSVPLPWPKPALKHPTLQPLVAAVTASSVPSRLFASEPRPGDGAGFVFEVYERAGLGARYYRWTASTPDALAELAKAVARSPIASLDGVAPDGCAAEATGESSPAAFLVCTQGSHDTCCGTYGVELADEIERKYPHVMVRRISHTGGHRYAPTLLALPGGRMWSFVDLGLVERITARTETADDLLNRCRGWWGAATGAEQVAECAARAEHDAPFTVEPTFETQEPSDGRTVHIVTTGATVVPVAVSVGREIPTIACEAPGGLPAKIAREYDAAVLDRWETAVSR